MIIQAWETKEGGWIEKCKEEGKIRNNIPPPSK